MYENLMNIMKTTQKLHDLGQSLWLDNITRDLLNSGTLQHYIDELSVTGLTSNPTIFDHALNMFQTAFTGFCPLERTLIKLGIGQTGESCSVAPR